MAEPFIVIAGNIGVGKSTLTERLAQTLQFKAYFEGYRANPFLPLYYQDMKRWGFHSQLYFITDALKDHMRIVNGRRGAIQDRSIYEHYHVFVHDLHRQGILTDDEFGVLSDVYESIRKLLLPPDLLVFLDAPAEALQQRIQGRGRNMEEAVSLDYLQHLERRYKNFVQEWDGSPVLVLDNLRYDVRQEEHLEKVTEMVLRKLREIEPLDRGPTAVDLGRSRWGRDG